MRGILLFVQCSNEELAISMNESLSQHLEVKFLLLKEVLEYVYICCKLSSNISVGDPSNFKSGELL